MSSSDETRKNSTDRISGALPFRFSRLIVKLNAQAARTLARASDLSLNQWRVFYLVHNLQPVTSKEIIELSAIDAALVSRNAKALIEKGLITFVRNEADNRERLLSLTPAGEELMEELEPNMKARRSFLDATFTEEERETLINLILRLEKRAGRDDF